MLLLAKDEDIKKLQMSNGIGYANKENVLIPAITLQEIDGLKSEKEEL